MNADVTVNPMVGRRVFLRPVLPGDALFLNQVASHPSTGAMWRWQGIPPGGDPVASTWPKLLAAFMVTARRDGNPAALAVANNADMLSRTCSVSYVASPELQGTGWHIEGAALFVNYLFRAWDMRKVYAEILGYNLVNFTRAFGWQGIREEGRLVDHVRLDGRYHDLVHLAIYRDEWLAGTERLLRRMTGLEPGPFIPDHALSNRHAEEPDRVPAGT